MNVLCSIQQKVALVRSLLLRTCRQHRLSLACTGSVNASTARSQRPTMTHTHRHPLATNWPMFAHNKHPLIMEYDGYQWTHSGNSNRSSFHCKAMHMNNSPYTQSTHHFVAHPCPHTQQTPSYNRARQVLPNTNSNSSDFLHQCTLSNTLVRIIMCTVKALQHTMVRHRLRQVDQPHLQLGLNARRTQTLVSAVAKTHACRYDISWLVLLSFDVTSL